MKVLDKKIILIITLLFSFFNSCEKKIEKTKEVSKKTMDSKFLTNEKIFSFLEKSPKINPNSKMGKPFESLNFEKVIAYEYQDSPNSDPYSSIITNEKFIPTITKQMYLTQTQAENLLSKLSNSKSYGIQPSICFYPHMSLIFFNGKKIVNVIDICLDCNQLSSNVNIDNQSKEFNGFSKYGRKAIIDFSKEINFKYKDYDTF